MTKGERFSLVVAVLPGAASLILSGSVGRNREARTDLRSPPSRPEKRLASSFLKPEECDDAGVRAENGGSSCNNCQRALGPRFGGYAFRVHDLQFGRASDGVLPQRNGPL